MTGILFGLERCPFTLALASIILVAAIWSRTHREILKDDHHRDFGFAPIHLPRMRWHRLVTSVFFTTGRSVFYISLVMLVICVCLTELRFGSRTTALVFWGTHFATLIAMTFLVVLPLHHLEIYPGTLLAHAHDVGPSGGYYGCLGAWCTTLPSGGPREVIIALILLVLLARLARTYAGRPTRGTCLSADLAHAIAFPLGTLAGFWLLGMG